MNKKSKESYFETAYIRKNSKLRSYKPLIVNGEYGLKYALIAAEVNECPICNKLMIKKLTKDEYQFYPCSIEINQDAQIKRAGLVYVSETKVGDEFICKECEDNGRAYFECELCNEQKSTDKKKMSFGDPPDFLCKDCYKTVSAEVWIEKCNKLHIDHKYDY